MNMLAKAFHELPITEKQSIHLCLGEYALSKWCEYGAPRQQINYVETVCGTDQTVDIELLTDAFCAACEGSDTRNVAYRFREPISALQDGDLTFPESITYAYYALYNLFQKYAEQKPVNDWLVVTQALSIEADESQRRSLLETAIQKATG
ncbi:MAG: hypothetical protein WBB01_21615 [Phormidesmis sp.]